MSTSNLKRRNRRRSKQPFTLEESPVDTMADQRTMAELLRAPTEGYAEAIVVSPILAEQFELKHSLINMMTSDQFFGLEKDNSHDHIRAASRWLEKEPPRSIHTWEAWDRYKDLLRACPHHGFTELDQLDTFYNALNPADQDSLNAVAGGNLLERRTQDVLTIIENKSKVRNSRSKLVVSQVKSYDVNSNASSEIAKLTHAVNQQMGVVTTTMKAMLKQFQATPPPAFVKAVEETCVTYGGAHPYHQCLAAGGNTFPELRDNIQGYVSAAAVNYNQGNPGYHPPAVILKKLPEKLGDPGKFLILCGFSELKCKALADLGASINLIPLYVWKKLGLPEHISTSNFVIVDYQSDLRVSLILGRPFLRTARALNDVHGEEMILRDGDERLTLNMRHDTSSYSNQPQKESINLINVF
uniref:Reverse transcriptase domain-containing protein n=1 Tax=Tanacetum cinerariifolium TaxID=118510 RepID=A0A6L2JCJ0_TANCI|nr:hypothetical protein [Tanacetum cinerariifolium]